VCCGVPFHAFLRPPPPSTLCLTPLAPIQSNPVGYWRLNDPAGSAFARNYGSAGIACDARVVDRGGMALGAACGLANDSSRFPFSKCVQRERGEGEARGGGRGAG
jgi:hypothetical protein